MVVLTTAGTAEATAEMRMNEARRVERHMKEHSQADLIISSTASELLPRDRFLNLSSFSQPCSHRTASFLRTAEPFFH